MKRIIQNLVLLVISLGMALAAAEGVLRLTDADNPSPIERPKENWAIVPERVWTEHHPVLGWYHQKNRRALLESKHFEDLIIRTNAQGFREERDYAQEKEKGITRLIFLGDSFVFGFGVETRDAFPARIENALEKAEAINLGVPGYGIDQIYLSYREIGRHFEGDYVFLGIFPADFWRATRKFADSGHAKPYFKVASDGSLQLENVPVPQPFEQRKGQFPDLFESPDWERPFLESRLYRLAKKQLIRLGKNTGLLDPDLSPEWRIGKAILQRAVEEIREDGAVPALLLMPPDRWAVKEQGSSLQASIRRFAARTGVDLIDLTPIFQERISKDNLGTYYIDGDGHWTAEGHALAAQEILAYLEKKANQRRTEAS